MDSIIPLKRCTKCKQEFPATSDFFQKHTRLGLQPRCKKCRSEDHKAYGDAHREQINARGRESYAKDRVRQNARGREYRKKNAEDVNARRRANYAFEREKRLESSRKSYAQHKDKVRISHHEYYVANRRAFRVRDANRRALELSIQGSYTAQDVQEQYKRQKGKCYWCRQKLTEYHVDHVIPLTREGSSNDPWNLVLACPPCNRSKGDKLPHEWPEGGRLF